MRVYKDVLKKSNINEVIEKFRSYSIVNIVDEEMDGEDPISISSLLKKYWLMIMMKMSTYQQKPGRSARVRSLNFILMI